jgi:ketosteroid isomerase-like protein
MLSALLERNLKTPCVPRIGETTELSTGRDQYFFGCAKDQDSLLLTMRQTPSVRTVAVTQLSREKDMVSSHESTMAKDADAQRLSEELADVFRTADIGNVLSEDVFLDGHPPEWRFQLQGRSAFGAWLKGYSPHGVETTVVRTVPTASGFVTEFVGRHDQDGELITDRKIVLCEVRDGRISEMTIYCSGDWNEELRARHASETTLIRP